jgi:hypothetical protein
MTESNWVKRRGFLWAGRGRAFQDGGIGTLSRWEIIMAIYEKHDTFKRGKSEALSLSTAGGAPVYFSQPFSHTDHAQRLVIGP